MPIDQTSEYEKLSMRKRDHRETFSDYINTFTMIYMLCRFGFSCS